MGPLVPRRVVPGRDVRALWVRSSRRGQRRHRIALLFTLLIAAACTPAAAQESDGETESSEPSCDPLSAPYLVSSEVTAPEWPFYGVVGVSVDEENSIQSSRIVVRIHNAISRTNTDIVVAEALMPYWMSTRATNAGIRVGPVSEAYVQVAPAGCDSVASPTTPMDLVIPWGAKAQLVPSDDQLRDPVGDLLPSYAERFSAGGKTFQIGNGRAGVHLRAGDLTRVYELAGLPDDDVSGPESSPIDRDPHRWESLKGTDGEHLAVVYWPIEPTSAPQEVYVVSLRTGDVVACGVLRSQRLLFVAPPHEGLLVDEIRLPPSGRLYLDELCSRDLSESFFDYLASLPPSRPRPPSTPRPISLPNNFAPERPFRGLVRTYTRDSAAFLSRDHHVQFYDIDGRRFTELVLEEFASQDLTPNLEVALDGLIVAEHDRSGTRVLVPWGGQAVLVRPEEPNYGFSQDDLLRPARAEDTGAGLRGYCASRRISLDGDDVTVTSSDAQLDGRRFSSELWVRVSAGDQFTDFLIGKPQAEAGASVAVEPACGLFSHGVDVSRSSGELLILRTPIQWSELYGVGERVVYIFSLRDGSLLACGVHGTGGELAVVATDAGSRTAGPVVLPPSGWLDTDACTRGILDNDGECTPFVVSATDEQQCERELDLGSIDEGPPLGWIVPVEIKANWDTS